MNPLADRVSKAAEEVLQPPAEDELKLLKTLDTLLQKCSLYLLKEETVKRMVGRLVNLTEEGPDTLKRDVLRAVWREASQGKIALGQDIIAKILICDRELFVEELERRLLQELSNEASDQGDAFHHALGSLPEAFQKMLEISLGLFLSSECDPSLAKAIRDSIHKISSRSTTQLLYPLRSQPLVCLLRTIQALGDHEDLQLLDSAIDHSLRILSDCPAEFRLLVLLFPESFSRVLRHSAVQGRNLHQVVLGRTDFGINELFVT